MHQNKELLRTKDVAEYLNVCPRTLANLQRRRLIPFYRVSRGLTLFRKADLDKALERFRIKTANELRGENLVESISRHEQEGGVR